MLIDCDSCQMREVACGDCVVTVLLGAPPSGVELGVEECQAINVLALSGLVPPLRLVVAPADGKSLSERGAGPPEGRAVG